MNSSVPLPAASSSALRFPSAWGMGPREARHKRDVEEEEEEEESGSLGRDATADDDDDGYSAVEESALNLSVAIRVGALPVVDANGK